MDGFEAVLREQIAAAREVRKYDAIRSYGLRLAYLLQIAEENQIELVECDVPGPAPRAGGGAR